MVLHVEIWLFQGRVEVWGVFGNVPGDCELCQGVYRYLQKKRNSFSQETLFPKNSRTHRSHTVARSLRGSTLLSTACCLSEPLRLVARLRRLRDHIDVLVRHDEILGVVVPVLVLLGHRHLAGRNLRLRCRFALELGFGGYILIRGWLWQCRGA